MEKFHYLKSFENVRFWVSLNTDKSFRHDIGFYSSCESTTKFDDQ